MICFRQFRYILSRTLLHQLTHPLLHCYRTIQQTLQLLNILLIHLLRSFIILHQSLILILLLLLLLPITIMIDPTTHNIKNKSQKQQPNKKNRHISRNKTNISTIPILVTISIDPYNPKNKNRIDYRSYIRLVWTNYTSSYHPYRTKSCNDITYEGVLP